MIRIIREEDEPKAVLMATFSLTDTQAEAILNMRLRSLRRLEEMEIRKEHDALSKERSSSISWSALRPRNGGPSPRRLRRPASSTALRPRSGGGAPLSR